MNMSDYGPLERQAMHNQNQDWSWCFAHPSQVLELTEQCRALMRRLKQIDALIEQARLQLGDHHIFRDQHPNVWETLEEIRKVTRSP